MPKIPRFLCNNSCPQTEEETYKTKYQATEVLCCIHNANDGEQDTLSDSPYEGGKSKCVYPERYNSFFTRYRQEFDNEGAICTSGLPLPAST